MASCGFEFERLARRNRIPSKITPERVELMIKFFAPPPEKTGALNKEISVLLKNKNNNLELENEK